MPSIRPVSDLRNYSDVLKDIREDRPVFLTKNGRGKYAILDMREYERMQAVIKLMSDISEGERSAQKDGWIDGDEVKRMFGVG